MRLTFLNRERFFGSKIAPNNKPTSSNMRRWVCSIIHLGLGFTKKVYIVFVLARERETPAGNANRLLAPRQLPRSPFSPFFVSQIRTLFLPLFLLTSDFEALPNSP